MQKLVHDTMDFAVIPCIFAFVYHLDGYHAMDAALVLACTPISQSFYSLVLDQWAISQFLQPMIFA